MTGQKLSEETVKLLKECDAGIKIAVRSLDEVLDTVQDVRFKKALKESKDDHQEIEAEILRLLSKMNQEGKDPSPMAKAMSWTKINFKIMTDQSDRTISEIIAEGCEMGIKTLEKLKAEYDKADQEAIEIADKIISLENGLKIRLKEHLSKD